MKYKKREENENSSSASKTCISVADYAKYTRAAAQLKARQLVINKSPKTYQSEGCEWQVVPEVRSAYYYIREGELTDFGLDPMLRCEDDKAALAGAAYSILGCGKPEKKLIEYTPGGARPPCPGGVEGTCVEPTESLEYTKGSQWEPDGPGNSMAVSLVYEYRYSYSNPTRLGSKPCGLPPVPTSWRRDEQSVGNVQSENLKRCVSRISNYDCCCSCPPDQVKVPQVVPGLAPCYNYNNASQAQLESLLKAATAALVVGACAAAVFFAAKYTALFLAGLAANPLTAGCAIRMIPLIVPCIVQEDESEN